MNQKTESKGIREDRVIKSYSLPKDYCTCTNCATCYDQYMKPTFCQEFSFFVNPEDTEANIKRGNDCNFFVAKTLNRAIYGTVEDHERWYEKDSIA